MCIEKCLSTAHQCPFTWKISNTVAGKVCPAHKNTYVCKSMHAKTAKTIK